MPGVGPGPRNSGKGGAVVRLLLATTLALSLSGCGDGRELVECKARLEAQAGAEAARLAEAERQAAVAQACVWGVNVCPASMLAPGAAAIRAGAGGGGALFWALVAGKLVALLVPLGAALGCLGWAWARVSSPALDDAEKARRLVDEAEGRAAKAKAAAARAAEQARQAQAEAEAWAQRATVAKAEAEAAREEAERARAVRDALTGL